MRIGWLPTTDKHATQGAQERGHARAACSGWLQVGVWPTAIILHMAARLFHVARASLLVAPALCLVRPPVLWQAGAFSAPPIVRLSATLAASSGGGGQSKRAARRRRFETRGAAAQTTTDTSLSGGSIDDSSSINARINQLTRLNQPHKVLQLFNATVAEEQPEVLPLVMRSLLKMRCMEAAIELQQRHSTGSALPLDTKSTCTLFLALCRTGRLEAATAMLAELERAHPPPSEEAAAAFVAAHADASSDTAPLEEPLWHAISSTLLPGLTLARIEAGEVADAVALAERLDAQPAAALPPEHALTRLARQFGRQRSLRGVFACLDAHAAAPHAEEGAEWRQVVVDAIVRHVRFVKGGVSMATLPDAPYPEVALVGRSNVGKSSLTNFFVGRRAIAYTSKTPGKTQQYNYFVVNEPTARDEATAAARAAGTFHLVDMPGLGYAKVPGAERKKWLGFLKTYARERPQLKLIVHLIDGEIGPLETDLMMMRMVKEAAADDMARAVAERRRAREAGAAADNGVAQASDDSDDSNGGDGVPFPGGGAGQWQYAIVLTKVDKGGPRAARRAEAKVWRAVEETGCPPPSDIVITSSSKKVGRSAMWRMMRRVMLAEDHKHPGLQ